jgi:ubiquinone/menaquinone biosynthesis C-methylase UbiE
MKYQDINARTVDRWVGEGWIWGIPISSETYDKAARGTWDVVLTSCRPVPKSWFGELRGKKVLGLASGGGQQIPVFAALGAACTVLDYSEKQLESERMVARREGYEVTAIRADMTEPLPFADETFDLIFHPVSDCYVREVKPIFRECFRVLKKGGALLGGYDNGLNFLVDDEEREILFSLPFDPLSNPEQRAVLEKNGDGMQFSHTLEEQLGGQLEAGFRIADLYEDLNGAGRLRDLNIPSFYAVRAVKPA